MALQFKDKVVVVTGAGGGLGRAYALAFSSRGARVVVNDLGTSTKGEGGGSKAADVVVEEIKAAGGQAVANYDSVEFGEKIVATAMDTWGRIDILINNAGILRDCSFAKMRDVDWDLIFKVHVEGSFKCTKAAWNTMREQKFGRIIMTSSAAGLYGNFGQANYSAAKLALLGFANTLAVEGKGRNIHVNTIAPVAGTRMTATVMPPDLVEALKPEFITPLVMFLCHESTAQTGGIFEVGAGWVSQLRQERALGHAFERSTFSAETLAAGFDKVVDFAGATHPETANDALMSIVGAVGSSSPALGRPAKKAPAASGGSGGKVGSDAVQPDKIMAYRFPETKMSYTARDSMFYALTVGACADPMDDKDLPLVYENASAFAALPTMGVLFPFAMMENVMNVDGLVFNPMMLLHGEQKLTIHTPLPTEGTITSSGRVKHVYDKGKDAVLVMTADSHDASGTLLCTNEMTVFIRGIGGFGGDRGPSVEAPALPSGPPHAVQRDQLPANLALLYRLSSGDRNPLHADPQLAAMGGFNQPILHGLCSFGHAGRAVLRHFCGNDPSRFRGIEARFSKHVFPGETLVTEMWQVSPTRIAFRCTVPERKAVVIANAHVDIQAAGDSAAAPAASADGFKVAPLFERMSKELKVSGADAVKRVGGIYCFVITGGPGGAKAEWTVDAKTGPVGTVQTGMHGTPDVTITVSDDDFAAIAAGDLDPQAAFMGGKLKMKGKMALAMKLGDLIGKKKAKM